jgi:hypothetical protein
MGNVEKGGGQAVQSPYCRTARRIVHAGADCDGCQRGGRTTQRALNTLEFVASHYLLWGYSGALGCFSAEVTKP